MPPGIKRIWINPNDRIDSNLERIQWFLYDYELVEKLNKGGIIFLSDLIKNNNLMSFIDLKSKIMNFSIGRIKLSMDNYKYILYNVNNFNFLFFVFLSPQLNK